MSTHPRTILACLAIGVALAACGNGGDDDGVAASDGTTTASTTTASTEPGADDTSLPPPIGNGGGDQAIGTIEVLITHPEADPVAYTIGCLGDAFPVTPEVPGIDGAAACQRLGDPAVLDRLVSGPPADQICTDIYGGPDVAEITGELDGAPIDATVDRADGCGIADWDDLLAGVLPPALGVT
jgi:hypothetical protein